MTDKPIEFESDGGRWRLSGEATPELDSYYWLRFGSGVTSSRPAIWRDDRCSGPGFFYEGKDREHGNVAAFCRAVAPAWDPCTQPAAQAEPSGANEPATREGDQLTCDGCGGGTVNMCRACGLPLSRPGATKPPPAEPASGGAERASHEETWWCPTCREYREVLSRATLADCAECEAEMHRAPDIRPLEREAAELREMLGDWQSWAMRLVVPPATCDSEIRDKLGEVIADEARLRYVVADLRALLAESEKANAELRDERKRTIEAWKDSSGYHDLLKAYADTCDERNALKTENAELRDSVDGEHAFNERLIRENQSIKDDRDALKTENAELRKERDELLREVDMAWRNDRPITNDEMIRLLEEQLAFHTSIRDAYPQRSPTSAIPAKLDGAVDALRGGIVEAPRDLDGADRPFELLAYALERGGKTDG